MTRQPVTTLPCRVGCGASLKAIPSHAICKACRALAWAWLKARCAGMASDAYQRLCNRTMGDADEIVRVATEMRAERELAAA